MDEPGIDLQRVLAEIDEQVRTKRASGELPADLERELDLIFARFAPANSLGGDVDQLLARADQQSFFDLLAPNESARPGAPQAKRVVQKAVRWYVRYVVEQVAGYAHTTNKLLRLLHERTEHLQQTVVPSEVVGELLARRSAAYDNAWTQLIVNALQGVEGRVLHARCGSGSVVAALQASGIDAYGVDPAAELVTKAVAQGPVDLRPDDELKHLRTLTPGSLAGVVLTGSVEVQAVGAKLALLDAAVDALAPGGVLAIASLSPQGWAEYGDVLVTDLAPGRPLHAQTWVHLLQQRGLVADAPQTLVPDALQTPDAFLVTARRP